MILTDPKGKSHFFSNGQWDGYIADSTGKCIEQYKNEYAQSRIHYWNQQGRILTDEQIMSYKSEYNAGRALTNEEVASLWRGKRIHGWTCTGLTSFILPMRVYYTDKGNEIHTLNIFRYQPYSTEEHYQFISHAPVESPDPTYNCHAEFIGRQGFLLQDKFNGYGGSQIKMILSDNNYYPIKNKDAQPNDLAIYFQPDGAIEHTGKVISNISGHITVESKPGDMGLIHHDLYDQEIMQVYGQPDIRRSDRLDEQGRQSNLLRTRKPTYNGPSFLDRLIRNWPG